MRLPTLRQLQYLTAVIDEKHFGRAAEKCHVTQSTLSAGIQDLEDLLEVSDARFSVEAPSSRSFFSFFARSRSAFLFFSGTDKWD